MNDIDEIRKLLANISCQLDDLAGGITISAAQVKNLPSTIPNRASRLRRMTIQSVPNNTGTSIIWDNAILHGAINWDSAEPTKIKFAGVPTVSMFCVVGLVQFATNANGYRNVGWSYPELGTGIGWVQCPPCAAVETFACFSDVLRIPASATYGTLNVQHTAGAALDILFASLAAFQVW